MDSSARARNGRGARHVCTAEAVARARESRAARGSPGLVTLPWKPTAKRQLVVEGENVQLSAVQALEDKDQSQRHDADDKADPSPTEPSMSLAWVGFLCTSDHPDQRGCSSLCRVTLSDLAGEA